MTLTPPDDIRPPPEHAPEPADLSIEHEAPAADSPGPNRAPGRVGVVGLGAIGRGLAGSLLAAGAELTVCDVRPEATEPFADRARVAADPAELAGCSDTVVIAVVDDAQVLEVVRGPRGLLAGALPSAVMVVVSTVSVATVTRIQPEASRHGVELIDCGVSGGPGAAARGQLVCMVGGEAEAVEAVQPVLDAVGSMTVHLGPLGSGLAAKLARNLVQYGSWFAAYEAQRIAEAASIDLVKLGQAIKASDALIGGASALMFRQSVAPWPEGTDAGLLEAMSGAAALARKDLGAARALADALGVAAPLAELTERYCEAVFGLAGPEGQVPAKGQAGEDGAAR